MVSSDSKEIWWHLIGRYHLEEFSSDRFIFDLGTMDGLSKLIVVDFFFNFDRTRSFLLWAGLGFRGAEPIDRIESIRSIGEGATGVSLFWCDRNSPFFSKLFLSFLCCCWKKSFPSLNTIGFLSDFFRFNQNSPYSSFGVYSSRISFIGLDFTEFRGPFFYWKKKKRKVDWSSLTATYFSSIFMNMQSKFFAVDGADFFSMATPFLNAVLFFFSSDELSF